MNSGRAEMLSRLPSLLGSRTPTIPEHEGEMIEAHPRFTFVATANDAGEGGRSLTARTLDRFPVILRFSYDSKIEAPLCPDRAVLAGFRSLREDPLIHSPVSTRLLVAFVRGREIYGPPVALGNLLGHFRPDERDSVERALSP